MIVQFDAGPVKVGDEAPYLPDLGETIFEATGHVKLVRIPHGPIVLQVGPAEPESTEAPEAFIQSHTIRYGPTDHQPDSGSDEVTFQNNFGDNAKIGKWMTGKTINITNLD